MVVDADTYQLLLEGQQLCFRAVPLEPIPEGLLTELVVLKKN
jgi:hypothetical protein